MTSITRRFRVRGIHFLYDPCHAEPKHGHEYILEVEVDARAGRDRLNDIVEKIILKNWDKTNWCEKGLKQASGELLVDEMDRLLRASWLGEHLISVVLRETYKNRFISSSSAQDTANTR